MSTTTTVTVAEVIYTAPAPSNTALASIISDRPTMTTREKREAKADRLREWADKRDTNHKADG